MEGKKYKERACCASGDTLPGTCPLLSPDPSETKEQTSNLGVILGVTAVGVAAVVAMCAYIFLHKKKSKTCGGGKGSSGRPFPSDSGDIEEKDIFVRSTDKNTAMTRPDIDSAQHPQESAPQATAAVGPDNIDASNSNINRGFAEDGTLGESTPDSEDVAVDHAFDDLEELEARLRSLRRK